MATDDKVLEITNGQTNAFLLVMGNPNVQSQIPQILRNPAQREAFQTLAHNIENVDKQFEADEKGVPHQPVEAAHIPSPTKPAPGNPEKVEWQNPPDEEINNSLKETIGATENVLIRNEPNETPQEVSGVPEGTPKQETPPKTEAAPQTTDGESQKSPESPTSTENVTKENSVNSENQTAELPIIGENVQNESGESDKRAE